ncbi:ATP-binding cassette domain-containing protein [Oceanospirillaceae bacterium ASx5O]|nr:ATP-binding cassette domain-containing protein [Oceanospirillaceae bacterium ASx5O]
MNAQPSSSMQRHYWRLLWQHKGMALLGILLAVITAFAGIALLAVSGWFISAAALAGLTVATAAVFNFFAPGAMVRGLSIARTAGRYGERLTSHEATFRLISQLRALVFRRLASRPWYEQQLNRHATSSRLLQDIQHIESIYLSALLPATVVLAVSAGYALVLALVLPPALWVALPVLLLTVGLMPWLYSRRVLEPQDRLHRLRAQQWQSAASLLSNGRTLTLHQRLAAAGDQLRSEAAAADQQEVQAVNRQQAMLLLTQILLVCLTVAVLALGFSAFGAGELAGANLFMVLLLTLGTGEVLVTASPVLAALRLGLAALQRLDDRPDSDWPEPRVRVAAPLPAVHLEQVDYRYPAQPQPVLQQFSHTFADPGWHWIIGRSGAGKSTLMALLSGQLQAGSGAVRIEAPQAQAPVLMPQRIDILRASLRDNLCLHHVCSEADIQQALQLVELDDWARSLPAGLDTWLGDGEWQPSGGEAKRIGLARLILQNPAIVLLDEPAAGMDAARAQRIFRRLAGHWADKLVIANTHDEGLIQPGQAQLRLP